ncbi:DUF1292 domain-containing protein [Tepidibacter formicigenes]|jgi:hypothetical protein|uniref:DUF1292 domain-containing protein n=1 Tax=Tepidibacter formicigenes DSM 15518 TaxID=1123349 RepID=A0A1M6M372_9FIRM|nr:DUF1292 domain-containing protein [Tepidibacter formicigenes]SHJ77911.1 hypothetical protein SAMN02744037_00809 [Tepidibacter formicigenes DSM 15518]
MDNIENFLKEEQDKYEKIYIDINYAIDNISDFISKENISKRKYVSKLSVIKDYLDLIKNTNDKLNKKSIFKLFNNKDKYKNDLIKYKIEHDRDFKQLNNCLKCSCLNCVKECNFDTCLGCRFDSKIVYCDHEKINVTAHHNFILDLINNNTGEKDKYEVLATIQDISKDKRYIVIRNINDFNEKYILYYYPGIIEDSYGEIIDVEEFDYIAQIFSSCNLE